MTLFHALGPISSAVASGDLQFITSATGSAAASISVSGCFSAAYDHYLVMFNLLGSNNNQFINARMRSGTTDDSGVNYRRQVLYATSTTVTGTRSTGDTSWLGVKFTELTSIGFAALWVSNPFGSVRTTGWSNHGYDQTNLLQIESTVYEHDLTTSYDGITILVGSGTVTGTIYVYGLKV